MLWTNLHSRLLGAAFEMVLGKPNPGSVAFARCLAPDVVDALARSDAFSPGPWRVWRVSDHNEPNLRTITADHAVEVREAKSDAALLLVDTPRAGAGMDGIYSAAQEVPELTLFDQARRLAANEITRTRSREVRKLSESALKRARRFGGRLSVSNWTEFDYLTRVAAESRHPGELLHLIGLWPASEDAADDWDHVLELSHIFVELLLGNRVAGLLPGQRIENLKLLNPSPTQVIDLERFLRGAATRPTLLALQDLASQPQLWVNALRIEALAKAIQRIELLTWRTNTGSVAKWSGLTEAEDPEQPPVLVLRPDADRTGDYSKLEIRWRAFPDNLERGAVTYRVAVVTDMEEELAVREITHSAKREEKCRFTNDDFATLSEDSLICAKVVVTAVGSDRVELQESEEITVRFGQPPERDRSGIGKEFRTLCEGVIELSDAALIPDLAASAPVFEDAKGFVVLRTREKGKTFRVFRPALLRDVEEQWAALGGQIGRWRVKVRSAGARAGQPEFIPFRNDGSSPLAQSPVWDRASTASRRLAERFGASGGGVAQIYDPNAKHFDSIVKEYLLAWAALLEDATPLLALANTVEVQSLSGRTIGLIVLPNHASRVAWHVAYDALVLYAAFEQRAAPKHIREEFGIVDGSMFPPFLPGFDGASSFVFADSLRFHAVAMVLDNDKEPKASVAVLARALGEAEAADAIPVVGRQSAEVLGVEILNYLACHDTAKVLHVHALRPGDGLTIARSLGRVQERYRRPEYDENAEAHDEIAAPPFVLELYPSDEQRGVTGRFIAEAREKRRRGAGVLAREDQWMLDSVSLPGGTNLPRLRWARKETPNPRTPAHLAVAFDTFESRVVPDGKGDAGATGPLLVYGLLSLFDRSYTDMPSPVWQSSISISSDGERHPADRAHSERLIRLQHAILNSVARNLGSPTGRPTLRTEISPEKAHTLRELHRLCDWVITLDRNAGVEYFDSPRSNKEIYDAYVIDCVPEREDLGCLQLITSTSNLDEVRSLLDGALDQMSLSQSRRNAEFLLDQLKSLSGRLAIRLTGQRAPTAELIALALSQANCRVARTQQDCWMPLLSGVLIPVDDVLDLIPQLSSIGADEQATSARPDLIYVSVAPRRGLVFQFIEVKYRRHLRAARSAELMDGINLQVSSLRERWNRWYGIEGVNPSFRAIRRAKLARVLKFYADKARRHYLSDENYLVMKSEIDRMVEKGAECSFAEIDRPDRGWVFCPEFAGLNPLEISASEWDTRVFLFGPGMLPDSDFRQGVIGTVPPTDDFSEVRHTSIDAQHTSVHDRPRDAEASKNSAAVDVQIVLGTDALTDTEVRWHLSIGGNPHLLMAGLPGMGKTTCLLNICKQMVAAGVRPIVFSYHEDIDERLQQINEAVRFIDYDGLGFNPLRVIDRSSPMAYLDVAGAMRDIFLAIYPELGDIQGEAIRRAVKESFVERGWPNASADSQALLEPAFERFVEILRAEPKPDRGLRTLLGRLEELADYRFFEQSKSQASLWDCDQPVVIRIHATQNDNLQKAFASLVFYGMYKDMFRRGLQDRITHAVLFDEAHRAAKLRLIPTMAKECRKYGISLVLASQEARDFNVSVFSAIANYLVLRLNEADAKSLVRNVASSDQERTLIDRIKQMERFRGLYFGESKRRPSLVALQQA